MKNGTKTFRLVSASLLAALVCVATMIIRIPSPFKGYLNLGDCVVLIAGWMLSPAYGFAAAGIGSALADILSGYIIYAPATFVIKGLMALAACGCSNILGRKTGRLPARIVGGAAAAGIMTSGYFLFEGLLYGFAASVVNILPNVLQGAAGVIFGVLLMSLLDRHRTGTDGKR